MKLLAFVLPLLLGAAPPALAAPTPHHDTERPARASRARAPASAPPVGVVIDAMNPRYLAATSTLRLRGQVTNGSRATYEQVMVRLRYASSALNSRGELETYADGRGADPPGFTPGRMVAPNLPAGGRAAWTLTVPVRSMGLREFGVYPVEVEVFNASGVLGRQRTFVTYYPKGTIAQKTRISWIWPVIDQPHRADDAAFVDDRLERSLGSGRLAGIVRAAATTPTPVTWLVDPGLVDDAAEMAAQDGYRIKETVRRPHSVAAESWLTALRGAVGGDKLVATPYADPDVMALAHAGLSKDFTLAVNAAVPALHRAGLGSAGTSVAVPPDGIADQQTLTALVAAGSGTVVLSSAVLPNPQAQTYTPDPLVRRTISGRNVTLIAYDDTLRKVLGDDTNAEGRAVLAEQRFLAETAMITNERPQQPRTIVVMPPRRWNPDPVFARHVLTYSAKAPWLQAVPFKDVESSRPVGRVLQPPRSVSGLSRAHLRRVKELGARIRRFDSIFQPGTDGQPTSSGFLLGIPRAESSAWDDQSRRGAALRQTIDDRLDRTTGRIRVLNDRIDLAGRSAKIPLTISNGLSRGTVQVRLHAYSQNDTRLRVQGGDKLIRLDAGHKDQITLQMSASANGLAYVTIELLAPDDRPFGEATILTVRATAYGRTALLITGISLAVLFLGVGIRVIRRRGDRAEEAGD